MSFHLQRMALAAANTAAALTTRAVKFVGSAQKRFLRKLQLQTAQRVVAAPQSIQQKAQKLDAAAGDSAAVNDMVDDDNGEWANLGVAANALNIGMDAAALGWTVYAATASTAANSSGVDTQAIEETGWTNPATGAGAGVVVTAAAAVALAVGVNLAAAAALCAVVAVARGLIHVMEKAAAAQAAEAQEKKQKKEEREKKEKEEKEKKEREEKEKKEKEEREKKEKEEREKKEREEREKKEKEERGKKEKEERNGRLRTYALIGGAVILAVAVGSIVYASGGTAAPVAEEVVRQTAPLVQNSIGQWIHSATGWFASKATVASQGLTWIAGGAFTFGAPVVGGGHCHRGDRAPSAGPGDWARGFLLISPAQTVVLPGPRRGAGERGG